MHSGYIQCTYSLLNYIFLRTLIGLHLTDDFIINLYDIYLISRIIRSYKGNYYYFFLNLKRTSKWLLK